MALVREQMTGLEYVQAVRDGLMPQAKIIDTVGWRLTSVEKGSIVITVTPPPSLAGNHGHLHGGGIALLMDGATASAMNTSLDKGVRCKTLDLRVTYLNAVPMDLPRIMVRANVVQTRRTVGVAEAKMVDDAGELYAFATATFIIRQARPAK